MDHVGVVDVVGPETWLCCGGWRLRWTGGYLPSSRFKYGVKLGQAT